jgi:hypothetical protein
MTIHRLDLWSIRVPAKSGGDGLMPSPLPVSVVNRDEDNEASLTVGHPLDNSYESRVEARGAEGSPSKGHRLAACGSQDATAERASSSPRLPW